MTLPRVRTRMPSRMGSTKLNSILACNPACTTYRLCRRCRARSWTRAAVVDACGCRCARLDLMGEIVERRRAEGGKRMSDAPTFGRYAEIPVDRMTPDQMKGYRSMIDGPRGRLPGPYK